MADRSLSQSTGAELLTRAIITEAQAEAAKIRAAAKAEADALLAEAGAEATRRRETAAEEEKTRALKEKGKTLALAELEARRLFLRAREELIEQVFVRTAEALAAVRKQPAYASLLRRLIYEGIAALAGEGFVVEVAPEDLSLTEEVLSSPPVSGKKVEARATESVSGGCRVWQQDRRVFYDNSFVGMLSRQKARLRPLIATWLFGTEKYWKG